MPFVESFPVCVNLLWGTQGTPKGPCTSHLTVVGYLYTSPQTLEAARGPESPDALITENREPLTLRPAPVFLPGGT